MQETTPIEFGKLARALCAIAHRLDLRTPVFTTPPRVSGTRRSIRRRVNSDVIAVKLKGRPLGAVAADLIDGMVLANVDQVADTDLLRDQLYNAIRVSISQHYLLDSAQSAASNGLSIVSEPRVQNTATDQNDGDKESPESVVIETSKTQNTTLDGLGFADKATNPVADEVTETLGTGFKPLQLIEAA